MKQFNRKRIVSMLLFSIAALAFVLACSIGFSEPIVSQNASTATRRATRVARATFTPRPEVTNTPIPEPTDEPTQEPTAEPTAVPVTETRRPTRRPVTAAPTNPPAPQPTNPPAATTNPYPFGFVSHTCAHSGGSHIFVVVFSDYKNPNSQMAGARVAASYAPDAAPFGDTYGVTGADGSFDYVMAEPGVWTGTTYAWVVDKDNRRISEIAGPVELNDKGPDDPGTCHHVKYFFARGAP